MPELPDVTVYVEHLDRRVTGATLDGARIWSLNLLRTAEPPLESAFGRRVTGVSRLGKRIVLAVEGELYLVFHLMISGRLHWVDTADAKEPPQRPRKVDLAWFRFSTGVLSLTEASTQQRASLHVVPGADAVRALDRGGIEVLEASEAEFAVALRAENHTLKRSLTDPRTLSGIGNAYSDEILHRARLSPLLLTSRIDDEQMRRLYDATRATLVDWTDRLRRHYGDSFPEKVTAFREGMAVHGRYREPCPDCGAPVQRIRYASNETNYCARCQTGGRLLADRAMSRLLRSDWPKTLDEMMEE